MFGYVRPITEKLSEEDAAQFQAAYCGLCRTIGQRYGVFSRLFLNYDFTFLAILFLGSDKADISCFRCAMQPLHQKKCIPESPALNWAADESMILTYWKIEDQICDSSFMHAIPYRFLKCFYSHAYHKARQRCPKFDRIAEEKLRQLRGLEIEECASIDHTADCFASILAAATADLPATISSPAMAQLLYQLGRWIYLIDALDDLKEDIHAHRYNPLRYRYYIEQDTLAEEDRKQFIATLDLSINLVSSAFELMDFGMRTELLRNIIYFGIPSASRLVLEGKWNNTHRRKHDVQD